MMLTADVLGSVVMILTAEFLVEPQEPYLSFMTPELNTVRDKLKHHVV